MDYDELKDALLSWKKLKHESNAETYLFDCSNPQNNKLVARKGPRGGVSNPFPYKLYKILESREFDDIISWQPNGRSFILHDTQGFVDSVMPKYFKQSKFRSFQRQLNLYEFERIIFGPDTGGYFHPKFLRDHPELCKSMTRIAVKSASRYVKNRSREVPQTRGGYQLTVTTSAGYNALTWSEYSQSGICHGMCIDSNTNDVTTPMISKLFSQPESSCKDFLSLDLVDQQKNTMIPSNELTSLANECVSTHSSTMESRAPHVQFRSKVVSESSLFETPENREKKNCPFNDSLSDDMSCSLESSDLDFSCIFDIDDSLL